MNIKSPGPSECLLSDFWRLFLDIVFNDILTMQRFLDVSILLYSGGCQVCNFLVSNSVMEKFFVVVQKPVKVPMK